MSSFFRGFSWRRPRTWFRRGRTPPPDPFYFSRPAVEQGVAAALAESEHLVIHGPPHQGKTTLLARQLAGDAIYIECRPGFKRTQIYRVALSSLGYAVLVEKKKRRKAETTVQLGLGTSSVTAGGSGELEEVLRSVSVDLKNPSEVVHLISRIKQLPWLVLNNFQLLDSNTRRNLLFDLTLFTERPSIRIVIVGTWSSEDYLEEIEPSVAGRFRHVFVPSWSEDELRGAFGQWSSHNPALEAVRPRLEEFLALAGGDVSIFRALVEGYRSKSHGPSDVAGVPATAQEIVLGRFGRGLGTRLQALLALRECYLTYSSVEISLGISTNPKFRPTPGATAGDYLRTKINPLTNRPFPRFLEVLLDQEGNPQYVEEATGELGKTQTDTVRFILRKIHRAVQEGCTRVSLAALVHDFTMESVPQPIAVDEAKLRAIFGRVEEAQRRANIVPLLFAVDKTNDAVEIVDRRLELFLRTISSEDLEELFEDFEPIEVPDARRRNHVSAVLSQEQARAVVSQAMASAHVARAPSAPETAPESDLDEIEDRLADDEDT